MIYLLHIHWHFLHNYSRIQRKKSASTLKIHKPKNNWNQWFGRRSCGPQIVTIVELEQLRSKTFRSGKVMSYVSKTSVIFLALLFLAVLKIIATLFSDLLSIIQVTTVNFFKSVGRTELLHAAVCRRKYVFQITHNCKLEAIFCCMVDDWSPYVGTAVAVFHCQLQLLFADGGQ